MSIDWTRAVVTLCPFACAAGETGYGIQYVVHLLLVNPVPSNTCCIIIVLLLHSGCIVRQYLRLECHGIENQASILTTTGRQQQTR